MLKALLKKIQNTKVENESKNGDQDLNQKETSRNGHGKSGSQGETAENNSRLFLLHLAMVWNQFDFARDIIFPERGKQLKGYKKLNHQEIENWKQRHRYFDVDPPNWTVKQQLTTKGQMDLMRFAIENDRLDFIREFLNEQNLLKTWLTASELVYLYNNLKNVVVISLNST